MLVVRGVDSLSASLSEMEDADKIWLGRFTL